MSATTDLWFSRLSIVALAFVVRNAVNHHSRETVLYVAMLAATLVEYAVIYAKWSRLERK